MKLVLEWCGVAAFVILLLVCFVGEREAPQVRHPLRDDVPPWW